MGAGDRGAVAGAVVAGADVAGDDGFGDGGSDGSGSGDDGSGDGDAGGRLDAGGGSDVSVPPGVTPESGVTRIVRVGPGTAVVVVVLTSLVDRVHVWPSSSKRRGASPWSAETPCSATETV